MENETNFRMFYCVNEEGDRKFLEPREVTVAKERTSEMSDKTNELVMMDASMISEAKAQLCFQSE